MSTQAGIVVLILSQELAACSAYLPVLATAPTSTALPAAPAPTSRTVAGERWNLTTTLRSATGPEGCVVDTSDIYEFSDSLMTIERSGESIRLVVNVEDPTNLIEYEGTVVADVLTVPIKSSHGGGFSSAGWCSKRAGAGEVEVVSREAYVSGRFSEGGNTLTAEEVGTLHLRSGETLIFRTDWSAARQ